MPRTRLFFALAASVLLLALAVIAIIAAATLVQEPGADAPGIRLDPRIIENLTQMPNAAPLAGEAANDLNAIRAAVAACPDYSAARRAQMEQQIALLLNPSTIPPDVLIALGANPHNRLLFAIGSVTEIQWRLDGRAADSCLLAIGLAINDLLIAAGALPIASFAEA